MNVLVEKGRGRGERGKGERRRGTAERRGRREAGSGSREREGEHVRVGLWKGRIGVTPSAPNS